MPAVAEVMGAAPTGEAGKLHVYTAQVKSLPRPRSTRRLAASLVVLDQCVVVLGFLLARLFLLTQVASIARPTDTRHMFGSPAVGGRLDLPSSRGGVRVHAGGVWMWVGAVLANHHLTVATPWSLECLHGLRDQAAVSKAFVREQRHLVSSCKGRAVFEMLNGERTLVYSLLQAAPAVSESILHHLTDQPCPPCAEEEQQQSEFRSRAPSFHPSIYPPHSSLPPSLPPLSASLATGPDEAHRPARLPVV